MKPKFTILFKKYFEVLDGDFEQAKICTGKIRNAINEIKGLISA